MSARDGAARAAELRRDFDRAFADPLRAEAGDGAEAALALRAGTDVCVVRLSEMRGLLARPTVVPVPGPLPELLGLAGQRGALIPVYSLAALQGQPATGGSPAWMILVEADGLVGLGFEEMLGYVSLERSERPALPHAPGTAGAPLGPQAARVGEALRPLIDVPSLVAELRRRAAMVGAHRQE